MRRALASLLAVAGVAGLAGCGVGAGEEAAGTTLTVTDRFGAELLLDTDTPRSAGGDTVMRLLQRNAPEVVTRHGGGFVQSIAGRDGGRVDGRPVDWFLYVNGEASEVGAAAVRVREGDRIWWDRRDWGEAHGVQAVVGQYPAPFTSENERGRRVPTRVECEDPESAACDAVVETLVDLGIPAAKGALARNLSAETLRVVVGTWSAVRADRALRQLERGPQISGVYARPRADGSAIALLDAQGRERGGGPGTGLVAATKTPDEEPVWTVTGTDIASVEAAARAFAEDALENRFAVAVQRGGEPEGVPVG
jgi:hypothetical protein